MRVAGVALFRIAAATIVVAVLSTMCNAGENLGRVVAKSKMIEGGAIVFFADKAKVRNGDIFTVYRREERLGTVMLASWEGGRAVVVPWQMVSSTQVLRVGDTLHPVGNVSLEEAKSSTVAAPSVLGVSGNSGAVPQSTQTQEQTPVPSATQGPWQIRVTRSRSYVADTGYIRTDAELHVTGRPDIESVWVCVEWVDWHGGVMCHDAREVVLDNSSKSITLFSGFPGIRSVHSLDTDRIMADYSTGNITYHKELTAKVFLSRVRPPW